jgi:hypothetical protein
LVLEGIQPKKRKYPCSVNKLLENLDEPDVTILRDAINDSETWNAWALHKALKERNIILNDKAIKKHREGTCSC